ncbi:hypothetical protein Taro_033965 [Colocasia esculenta]|uniref:non-specific serine/threonine protein kinase n=1 Tax=Colocasia esculenta TaxID=4460 RepID=A0A843VV82_COLES|nr:hypothetical protein [Colocasia esculenta]
MRRRSRTTPSSLKLIPREDMAGMTRSLAREPPRQCRLLGSPLPSGNPASPSARRLLPCFGWKFSYGFVCCLLLRPANGPCRSYRAFDEYEGIEVAWNQVKLYDFLQSPEELERLYCEIHLLKTLKHKNIMKFYTSWVDTSKRNINFVTEMFTSGTLRQYRQKHRRVNIRAVKHWCRQILRGLLYLHSLDPPVIHRDLKCDNIFINGNQGEVKIGDLGLAAILRKSHAAHCVGTPEFMAPEVYEEEYNELVDIYSLGMCILEMVTLEYPYSECTHPVQIYKKGTKPEALYKVKDPEVRQFVEKCLATASRRLPAKELLKDPFLRIDDGDQLGSRVLDAGDLCPLVRQPSFSPHYSNGSLISNGFSNSLPHEGVNGWVYDHVDCEPHGIELFSCQEDDPFPNVDITIRGRRREDGRIFLRLRISDKDGRIRNIYFPFDIEADTALSVATEMVAELDITDYDVTRIAEMIDGEICSMVPDWRPGPGIEDTPGHPALAICHNCASNVSSIGSLLDYSPGCTNLQGGLRCTRLGCAAAAMHGRFEEITYQVEECMTEGAPVLSSHSEDPDMCSPSTSTEAPFDEDNHAQQLVKNESSSLVNNHELPVSRRSLGQLCCGSVDQQCLEVSGESCRQPTPSLSDDYENDIRQELRWLKAKYQMELRDYKSQQFGGSKGASSPHSELGYRDLRMRGNGAADASLFSPSQRSTAELLQSLHLGEQRTSFHRRHGSSFEAPPSPVTSSSARTDSGFCWSSRYSPESRRPRHCEVNCESSPEAMFTAKNFYTGLPPSCLPRTKSLPVDAVDA